MNPDDDAQPALDYLAVVAAAHDALAAQLKTLEGKLREAQRKATERQQEYRAEEERLQGVIGDLRTQLATAIRWSNRFRLALHTYLQERDGLLGVHAPSHDTLKRIRELLEETD